MIHFHRWKTKAAEVNCGHAWLKLGTDVRIIELSKLPSTAKRPRSPEYHASYTSGWMGIPGELCTGNAAQECQCGKRRWKRITQEKPEEDSWIAKGELQ